MPIKIVLTEEEILATPNYYELGEKVQNLYWNEVRNQKKIQSDYESLSLITDDEGVIQSVIENNSDEFDKCIVCGKDTPYRKSTHVDIRKGYIEGSGQGCYQSNQCNS